MKTGNSGGSVKLEDQAGRLGGARRNAVARSTSWRDYQLGCLSIITSYPVYFIIGSYKPVPGRLSIQLPDVLSILLAGVFRLVICYQLFCLFYYHEQIFLQEQ